VIIDFHTHVFPPRIREQRADYLKRDSCFALLYSNPSAKIITSDELIDSMDETGTDKSVILNLGWGSQEICRETNDYILESITKYPDRLVGFCTVQPAAGDKAIRELERCARCGVKGLGEMRPGEQGFDLRNGGLMKPLADILVTKGMIFLLHASEPVGHSYAGKGEITPQTIFPFIESYPELKVVCAHWGGGLPFYALMPEVEKALANVYFDTAATPFLYKPEVFERVADLVGSRKILFGSDYPLLSPKRIIDQIKSANLTGPDKARILGDNAQELLSI
jgi:predicted TIM-barrel fold metal-dependent hydrolase